MTAKALRTKIIGHARYADMGQMLLDGILVAFVRRRRLCARKLDVTQGNDKLIGSMRTTIEFFIMPLLRKDGERFIGANIYWSKFRLR